MIKFTLAFLKSDDLIAALALLLVSVTFSLLLKALVFLSSFETVDFEVDETDSISLISTIFYV
jgi:hypothetical protein